MTRWTGLLRKAFGAERRQTPRTVIPTLTLTIDGETYVSARTGSPAG